MNDHSWFGQASIAATLQHRPRALPPSGQHPCLALGHTTIDLDRALCAEMLARCGLAVMVTEGDGKMLYANASALVLLQRRQCLRMERRRLTTHDPSDAAKLTRMLRLASEASAQAREEDLWLAMRDSHGVLGLLITPLRTSPSKVIVWAHDTSRPTDTASAAQKIYGLTPSEAEIAVALSNGHNLADIAKQRRTSAETVRKQLKVVLAKTGTKRQAECAVKVLRDTALMTLVQPPMRQGRRPQPA